MKKYIFFIALAVILSYPLISLYSGVDRFLEWDEVRYANAAKLGILNNAFERNSLSMASYIKLGIAKFKKDLNRMKQIIKDFPDEKHDPFILRGVHPPVTVYFLTFFTDKSPIEETRNFRISSLVLVVIFLAALLFAVTTDSPINESNAWAVLLVSSVLMTSKYFLTCFFLVNFHTSLCITSFLFTGFLIRSIKNPARFNLYILGFLLALMCAILESVVFIFFGALAAVAILRFYTVFRPKEIRATILSFIISLILIWPGVLYTGGPIKSWLIYFYRMFARKAETYRSAESLNNWMDIAKSNPLLWAVIIFGIIVYFFKKNKLPKHVLAPVITGVVYLIFMGLVIGRQEFTLSGLGLLCFGTILILKNLNLSDGEYSREPKPIVQSVLHSRIVLSSVLLLLFFSFSTDQARWIQDYTISQTGSFREIVDFVKGFTKRDRPIFADSGHVFRYYLESENIKDLETFTFKPLDPSFYERVNYEYIDRWNNIRARDYCAIVLKKIREWNPSDLAQIAEYGYKRRDFKDYIVFYDEE